MTSFSYPCIHVKSAGGFKNENTDCRETGRHKDGEKSYSFPLSLPLSIFGVQPSPSVFVSKILEGWDF